MLTLFQDNALSETNQFGLPKMQNRISSEFRLDGSGSIASALAAIRKHLGMEVAYLSEFVENQSVFREVDAPGLEALIKVGDTHSLDDVYCRHILEGRLPELISDTADNELARSMPITQAVPIGAHMSVPIRLSDGRVFGMFCCLSPHANKSLNDRDLQVMRVFAEMAANQIAHADDEDRDRKKTQERIERVIDEDRFSFMFQPIWEFRHSRPVGFEVLCRFSDEPYRTPDLWFAEAAKVGYGARLEIAVLRRAVEALDTFPDDVFLSVNASPQTIMGGELLRLFSALPLKRLVLEVTEHAPVDDYKALSDALVPLRQFGMRLAIDDAGAGYSGLQHIVRLMPDIIKLDMQLTRSVDTDPARRALAAALLFYSRETGCSIVAEGIETEKEMETLRTLGVPKGQGYFLGRPMKSLGAQELVKKPERKSA